jgi:hypothetical protein
MTNKKMSKDTKDAWEGYNHILDIMQEGLKQGIDEAVEDFRDPNGVWSTAKDADDFANKLAAKHRRRDGLH